MSENSIEEDTEDCVSEDCEEKDVTEAIREKIKDWECSAKELGEYYYTKGWMCTMDKPHSEVLDIVNRHLPERYYSQTITYREYRELKDMLYPMMEDYKWNKMKICMIVTRKTVKDEIGTEEWKPKKRVKMITGPFSPFGGLWYLKGHMLWTVVRDRFLDVNTTLDQKMLILHWLNAQITPTVEGDFLPADITEWEKFAKLIFADICEKRYAFRGRRVRIEDYPYFRICILRVMKKTVRIVDFLSTLNLDKERYRNLYDDILKDPK